MVNAKLLLHQLYFLYL